MKILIVSDTHGRIDHLKEAAKRTEEFSWLIHCGDVEDQEEEVRELADEYHAGCTLVRGNNDWDSSLPISTVAEFGKFRLFVTHGHRFGVSYGTDTLKKEAAKEGCNVAVYGHIHYPVLDESDPAMTVLNPGSLTFPRQENRRPSYIVMEIVRDSTALYTVNYLGKRREKRRWPFF